MTNSTATAPTSFFAATASTPPVGQIATGIELGTGALVAGIVATVDSVWTSDTGQTFGRYTLRSGQRIISVTS